MWIRLVCLAAALAAGCGSVNQVDDELDDAGATNAPPTVDELIIESTNPGVPIDVSCTASDPDGDTLTFSYTTDVGAIDGSGGSAIWTPGIEAEGSVTCAVADGNGGTDELVVTETLLVADGLVSRYTFDGDGADSAGGNDATITGLNGGSFSEDRFGNPEGALDMPGTTTVRVEGNEAAFDFDQEFTLAAWVSIAPSETRRPIVAKASDTSFGNYHLEIFDDADVENGGKLLYNHDGNASPFGRFVSSAPVSQGAFTHVALTFRAEAMVGYVGGQPDITVGEPLTPPLNDEELTIGTSGQGTFVGAIDEVRIYSRALSDEEIRAMAEGRL